MYPTIVLNNNISFDTLNCKCCEYNPDAKINQETIDMINQNLKKNKINRTVTKYWTCKRRKGAFPKILHQVLSDREKHLQLLKEEKNKQAPNQILVEEYKMHQTGAKLFTNAGFGLFGNEYFKFSNYKVAECITGEGRRIHNNMEQMANQAPFNFEIVFGFTDSIFVRVKEDNEKAADKIKEFIDKCKQELGVTVEIKNVFLNSIVYGKKNWFIGWSGKEDEDIVIKGLDGLADSNPLWVRKLFSKS
jgi:DNA polymerase, archaea type